MKFEPYIEDSLSKQNTRIKCCRSIFLAHFFQALEENDARIQLLLQMLKSRGYEFYRRFLLVLRKTGHNYLADKLEPISAKKQVTFSSIPKVQDVTSSSSSSSSSTSSDSNDEDTSDSMRSRRRPVRKKVIFFISVGSWILHPH